MGEDEQGSPVGSSEQDLQRPVGYVDAADRLAVATVNEHLAVGDIDPALSVDRDAFAAAIGERLEVGEGAAGSDRAAVSDIFRPVGDEDPLAPPASDEPVRVETVRPAPADVIGRTLLPDPKGRQRQAAIGRDIFLRLGSARLARK